MDCSVKRSRHMSNDGAPMSYQASYPEPRVSPQTATPPSSGTEEKRVIVPAGELTHSHELAVILDQPPHTTFPKNRPNWAQAISITELNMGAVCLCFSPFFCKLPPLTMILLYHRCQLEHDITMIHGCYFKSVKPKE